MNGADALERLIAVLARLPGIGRRSAERIALKLARDSTALVDDLTTALREVSASVRWCSLCGSVTTQNADPCRLCTDPTRDAGLLCVVEDSTDIGIIERSGGFKGRYHALNGRISPMKGEGAESVRVRSLLARIDSERVREVVLALNTDVESDATASYLADQIRPRRVKVTRLAFGLPAGSGIVYSDPVTLARAIKGRQEA